MLSSRLLRPFTTAGKLVQAQRGAFSTKPLATPPQPNINITQSHATPQQAPSSSSARSVVHHPYSLTPDPLPTTPATARDMFAIVAHSGTQYKVVVDDMLVADRVEGLDIGDKVSLDVLLVGSRRATIVGRPLVPDARVVCEVEELAKDKKVVTLKTRRRKNSRSLVGFRRQLTIFRVLDIELSDEDRGAL